MKKLLLLLGLVLTLSYTHAQFVAEYASEGQNMRFTAIAKRNGNYIAAGTKGNHIVISEIRPNGVLVRSSFLFVDDLTVEQPVKSLIVDSDGFIVVAGYRNPEDVSISEAFVLKYDWELDSVVWSHVFDQAGSNLFKIIEKSPGGNYYTSGMVRTDDGDMHAVLIEVDRYTGAWTFLDMSSHDVNSDTYFSMDNSTLNIYLAGRQHFSGGGADTFRSTITKTDNFGNLVYNNNYLRDTADYARLYGADILVKAKQVIMLACGGGSTIDYARDLYAVSTAVNGKVKWSNYYDITSTTLDGTWLSIKPYGKNSIIAGSMYNPNDPQGFGHGGKMFVLYVDESGQLIWANSYELNSDFYYFLGHTDMLIVDGNHFVLAGSLKNPTTGKFHAVVLKAPIIDGVLPDGCSTPLDVEVIPDNTSRQFANLYDADEIYTEVEVASPLLVSEAYNYDLYCEVDAFVEYKDANEVGTGPMLIVSPADQQLNYLLPVTEQQTAVVSIYTIQGECIHIQTAEIQQTNVVSIEALPSGTYILVVQLSDGSKRWNEPFVVMKR